MRADIWLGIVTVFMAVLGGIVSAHAPTNKWHKIAYMVVFVMAGAASVRLVIRISNESEASNVGLTNAVGNLNQSTHEITRMTKLNTELQEKLLAQDAGISKLAEESFKNIVGADSFAYVSPQPADYGRPIPLFVWDHGKYNLTGVTLTFREGNDFSWLGTPIEVGTLHPGWGKPLGIMLTPKPDEKSGIASYSVEIYTQSDFMTEMLYFRKSKDGKFWVSSFNVQKHKFGRRIEKPFKIPKVPPLPPNGSATFPIYVREWPDESPKQHN